VPTPLSLACPAPGVPTLTFCTLTKFTFVLEVAYTSATIGAAHGVYVDYSGGGLLAITNPSDGIHEFDIPLSVLPDWDSITVRGNIANSITQFCGPGLYASVQWKWKIRQTYDCYRLDTDTTSQLEIDSFPTTGDFCEDDRPGDPCPIWSMAFAGAAGGQAFLWRSSPLGGGGCDVTVGVFRPSPLDDIVDPEASDTGDWCLVASGGNPPYYFSVIAGSLGSLTLNGTTGCLEGDIGGLPGSGSVTFRVTDSAGATADVTCGLPVGCGAEKLGAELY
jgi:hypothetical protein